MTLAERTQVMLSDLAAVRPPESGLYAFSTHAFRLQSGSFDALNSRFHGIYPPSFSSKQSVGALVPTPSVKPSSVKVYASQTERLVVEGDNFLLDTRLIFDPPLRDGSFWQQVGGFIDHGLDPRVSLKGG